jgi:hypothetical protein
MRSIWPERKTRSRDPSHRVAVRAPAPQLVMEVTVQGWESGDGHSLKRESARVRSGDTSTAAGKCFLDMLGVFAEFETNLRRERQLEGIAKAKAAGSTRAGPC